MSAATSQSPLTFSLLQDTARVIRATPAWPEVERSIATIRAAHRDGRSQKALEEQIAQVLQFEKMLRTSASRIADAIVCGSIIGQAVEEAGDDERIARGLRAIARAYRFDRLDVKRIDQRFLELTTVLRQRIPKLDPGSATTRSSRGNARFSIDEWVASVRERLAKVRAQLTGVRFDRLDVTLDAWTAWFDRNIGQSSVSETIPATGRGSLAEMICLAADWRPTTLLGFEPQDVSIGSWGIAIRESVIRDRGTFLPNWLPPVALRMLGVWLPPREAAQWIQTLRTDGSGVRDNDSVAQLVFGRDDYGPFPPPAHLGRALVIRRLDKSLVDPWSVHPGLALVPFEHAMLGALQERGRILLKTIGFTHVIIEDIGGPGQPFGRQELDSLLKELRAASPNLAGVLYMYASEPRETPPGHCVIAPRSPADLLPYITGTTSGPVLA